MRLCLELHFANVVEPVTKNLIKYSSAIQDGFFPSCSQIGKGREKKGTPS